MGFSRQEYWSGLPFPSPRDLPSSGIEPRSPALWADSTIWATREACKWKSLGCVWLYGTLWTIQSMEFPRLQYLEWVAFPFSRGYSQPRDWTQVSCIAGGFFISWVTRESQNKVEDHRGKLGASHSVVSDSLPPHSIANQAPLSMGFPRQEYWSG